MGENEDSENTIKVNKSTQNTAIADLADMDSERREEILKNMQNTTLSNSSSSKVKDISNLSEKEAKEVEEKMSDVGRKPWESPAVEKESRVEESTREAIGGTSEVMNFFKKNRNNEEVEL